MRLHQSKGLQSGAGRAFRAAVRPRCVGAVLLLNTQTLHAEPMIKDVPLRVDDYSSKYDDYFRLYSQRYFGPFVDWRWFKAMAVAESLLNPQAQSVAGARGVMQLLPRTFDELRVDNPGWGNIHAPRWNIAAGIYYSYTLYQQWSGALHGNDRFLLTLASYNAGVGRVRYAFALSKHVRSYKDIRHSLPVETRAYVDRIQSLMQPKPAEETPVVAELDPNETLTAGSQ